MASMRGALVRAYLLLSLAATPCARLAAVTFAIGTAEIDRAIDLGRKSEAERRRFHSPYLIRIDDATVVSLEVLSEFRRVVLESEERERLRNRHLDVIDAEAALRPWRNRVAVLAQLRFNPHNILISVPDYDMVLVGEPGEPDLISVNTRRIPFYNGTVIVTAVIEAQFDAKIVARARRTIVLRDREGQQVAAASFNFASVE